VEVFGGCLCSWGWQSVCEGYICSGVCVVYSGCDVDVCTEEGEQAVERVEWVTGREAMGFGGGVFIVSFIGV